MKKYFISILIVACQLHVPAQELFVDKGIFIIDAGGTVIIEGGSLQSNQNIPAFNGGKIIMKGNNYGANYINMNLSGGTNARPYTIPDLVIDNPYGVQLNGSLKIGNLLTFLNGSMYLNSYNLTFKNGSAASGGYSTNKCVITNGTGYCEYELAANNLTEGFVFPVGYPEPNPLPPINLGYVYSRPAPIYLANAGGTFSTGTPTLRAQVKYGRSPNAPIRTQSHTTAYWPIRVSGISSGNLTGTGYYGYAPSNTPDFTGTESEIVGFGYNNQDWLLTGNGQDAVGNSVTGTINTTTGEIFGMNKFVYLKAKALLQGAYASGGLMNDNLRTGTVGNLIPLSDPYRTAPYNTAFNHVNNPVAEVADASVFADQTNANDNIVDWVFVEIRNAVTTGSTILQTRSALIQKDGDIVDVDGKSLLYFKNLNDANYTVTIRHRNHLAMSTNNTRGLFARLSNLAYLTNFDFTTATASQLLGSGGNLNTSNYNITGGFNMLFGGNANAVLANNRISYSGSANDASYILGPVLNGAANVIGNPNGVYHWADVNMDGKVTFSGNNNDPGFIFTKSLGGFASSTRTEIKPQ